MYGKNYLLLGFLLLHAFVSESRVITSNALPKDGSRSGEIPLSLNPLEDDKKLEHGPGIWDEPGDFGVYEYDGGVNNPVGQPSDYDYRNPEKDDNDIGENKPDEKPEKFPSDLDLDEGTTEKPDEIVDDQYDVDKSEDEGFFEPFDGAEDSDKSTGDDKDSGPPVDEKEDKPIPKDVDESLPDDESDKEKPEEEVPIDEDDSDKNVDETEIEDEAEKHGSEEEEKEEEENDAEHVPNDGEEDGPNGDKEDVPKDDKEKPEGDDEEEDDDYDDHGVLDNSFFDNPFFNLKEVKKYFSQLDRALAYVFRRTADEALVLNGTYANTTEEEVEIDGKKYIVHKSVISGADNHSSIYVEALSSIPKMVESEGTNNMEVKNVTDI